MCGPAEPTSTSSCSHAMVCSDGISYGEPKNYQVEKESGGTTNNNYDNNNDNENDNELNNDENYFYYRTCL